MLITSCTYDTGDKKLATVVSHPDFSLPFAHRCARPGLEARGPTRGFLCFHEDGS